MRRAAKVDANQADIVKALRSLGASVKPCHTVGEGFPDLTVGYQGATYLAEVKDGSLPPSQRTLTNDQIEFHDAWRGGRPVILKSVDEAIEWVASLTETARTRHDPLP